MSKGGPPRRDLKLVKMLQAAESGAHRGFKPSSLLDDGSAILDKANKISGFLKNQKKRTGTTNAKGEWTGMQRQLQEER
eukprot:gene24152-9742_t